MAPGHHPGASLRLRKGWSKTLTLVYTRGMTRYHYRDGVTLEKKRGRAFLIILGVLIFAAAAYIAAIYLAPQMVTVPFTSATSDSVGRKIQQSKAGQDGDRLYLPQINVEVPLAAGGGSDALDAGAWLKDTTIGEPGQGGNTVVSARHFTWEMTPLWAKQKSPFYNLGKINQGDDVTLDYKGTRYVYRIDKRVEGASTSQLMKKTDEARLTLFATDGSGDSAVGAAISGTQISPVKRDTVSD